MRIFGISTIVLLGVALLVGTGLLLAGCSLRRPAPQSEASVRDLTAREGDANQKVAMRVAGDLEATTELANGEFRSGSFRITTPLPDGYPPPTPPGAIDIKCYPLVRRAAIGGTMTPDWGMNFAFFPLFNHIKRREIAMTSPVEMNYDGLSDEASEKPSSWTMSFVYRTPELGPPGADPKDERILIEDIPPMTVVSIGVQGPYKLALVNKGLAELRDWLAGQSEWQAAGEPRALFYNGPDVPTHLNWSEIQIPVRRRLLSESGS